MKISRLFAIIICVFAAVSLLGCGGIDLGDLGSLGLPIDEIPFIGDFTAEADVSEIFTADIYTTEAAVEATTEPEETWQVVWQTQEPAMTTAYYEDSYEPAETSAQRYYDGSCTHMHNQEAEALYRTYGGLLSREEYAQKEEYLRTHRVVIASGGLNLRAEPVNGDVLTLIPEGEIITVYEYRNEWAQVYYNGYYGWCSMEFLFEPFLGNADSPPLAYATVTYSKGVELVTDRHCYDDDTVSMKIPYNAQVTVYGWGGDEAFVSYKNIYGYCSTAYLDY